MITLASKEQIPAAVARCVRLCSHSQHRAPLTVKTDCRGAMANVDRAICPGRKRCRIKRCHHRIPHHPAVRVEDTCYSAINASYQTISKIRRGITFVPLLPLVTLSATEKTAATGFLQPSRVAWQAFEADHPRKIALPR